MNYTDEEVELITEWHAIRKRFVEAKAGNDPKEYAAAKKAMSEYRSTWRGIRELAQDADPNFPPQDAEPDGTAATKPVSVTSTVKEG